LKSEIIPVREGAFLRPLLSFSALLVISLIVTLSGQSAWAASPASQRGKLVKPGHLVLAGTTVKCGAIPALINDHYPDYGAAQRGLIILNLRKLAPLPRGARLLIYYHECGHQHVGGSELAADCWAVQKVRRAGLLDRGGLKNACTFIEHLPANKHHPSGKMRCREMMRCYNRAAPRNRLVRRGGPRPVIWHPLHPRAYSIGLRQSQSRRPVRGRR
jgi:hypothetical protein